MAMAYIALQGHTQAGPAPSGAKRRGRRQSAISAMRRTDEHRLHPSSYLHLSSIVCEPRGSPGGCSRGVLRGHPRCATRSTVAPRQGLLDDCFKQNPQVGKQEEPVPGVHNSQWVASPGERSVKDPRSWPDRRRPVHRPGNHRHAPRRNENATTPLARIPHRPGERATLLGERCGNGACRQAVHPIPRGLRRKPSHTHDWPT